MNIEHPSSRATWTNTTSSELDFTANDTFYYQYLGWDELVRSRKKTIDLNDMQREFIVSFDKYITPDTPLTRSATLTTSSESGNYLWPMWLFWAVAVALTLGSVILPLVLPPSYRWLARITLQWRRSFRAFISFLWIL